MTEWTHQEDEVLLDRRNAGYSFPDIASDLRIVLFKDRSPAACRARYQKLMARDSESRDDREASPGVMAGSSGSESAALLEAPDGFNVEGAWIKDDAKSVYVRRTRPIEDPTEEAVKLIWEDMVEDIAGLRRADPDPLPNRPPLDYNAEQHMLEVAVFDPHIGMLAWGKECGLPYDTDIASRDYSAAVEHALQHASMYNVERILFIVGNDLFHVDALGEFARGGATTKGTPQDIDSRLAKLFVAVERVVIEGIDKAREIAPVDVLVVPGNHDRETCFRFSRVLSAWYRHDDEVTILAEPRKRHYYQYGNNALMFTHGEEYKRKREPLPLIFATECPPEIWASTQHREVHTGHNHIAMAGGYAPTGTLDETRAIRTRSLPGLTPADSWHTDEGYKHIRTGTALVWRRSGGLAGLHEFNITADY